MGGAERSARKKKQAARAVTQARASGGSDRTKVIAGVAVVAVLAIAVIGYVVFQQMKPSTSATDAIPLTSPDHIISAPAVRDGSTVLVGKDTATATVDVYEDFLCPICGTFEKTYGSDIKKAVEDGKVKVRYHMLPMLDSRSDPAGYSSDSANAGLCVADDGKFNAFHAALFYAQPEEGEAGYTKDQLIKLGKEVGVTSASFESCVQNQTYKSQLDELMSKTSNDPALKDAETGRFRGTPSVASGGKLVDLDNKNWLSDLTK
ncbi:thioredoxin domain-containing protein [Lentzea sp. BCCO 10_0856]|uniref:Thioredoxin domain-containing protein n=1 Tax=Lentzea miocenica TaxID=3095431 RepID=A0ABU4TCT1_9PSEU|nr:thioredoxin domain-containing protein [Lentzea sp. BCCO 10_0856]MDX8035998.1 thioredoxin domain-containing protein [Lentzea sp. BCCO 10_0856]